MRKITRKEVAALREKYTEEQGWVCALCNTPFGEARNPPCLDHHHKTGVVRGVLHRGCNTFLGYIENHYTRACLTKERLYSALTQAVPYIQGAHDKPLIHFTSKRKVEK